MGKILLFICACCLQTLFLFAQHDSQTSIYTDDGVFTVSQTTTGEDMIFLRIDLWNDMVSGTKFHAGNLTTFLAKKILIEISNKKQLHCKGGIGFRCGIFDEVDKVKKHPVAVNDKNRICSVMIQKQDASTVKLIFLDRVDWADLQHNQ